MTAMTNVYPRARRVLGALALVAITSGCDQPTQLDRSSDAAEPAALPINLEVAMTLSAIVDDDRTRVLPVFEDAATATALDSALGELREALDARSQAGVSSARVRLARAVAMAAEGPEGRTNEADLDVVRLLLEQMDDVLPPTTL